MPFQAQPIAKKIISWAEYQENGCPICNDGTKEGYPMVQGPGFTLVVCSKCRVGYEINDEKAAAQVEESND